MRRLLLALEDAGDSGVSPKVYDDAATLIRKRVYEHDSINFKEFVARAKIPGVGL